MGYSIDIDLTDFEKIECGEIVNLTLDKMTDESIIKEQSFCDWFDDNIDVTDYCDYDENDEIIELSEDEIHTLKIDNIDDFKSSEAYFNLQGDYAPMVNSLHILQQEPSAAAIELVSKYVDGVALYKLDDLGVSGIAILGCGMDMSDYIELAYYLTDGVSPIKASQIMSLSDEAEKLLLWFRKQKETTHTRYISRFEMNKYLREIA